MKTELTIHFLWIPAELGGNQAGPYSGMRLSVRWQKYLAEYLECARDIECLALVFDPQTLRGQTTCTISSDEPLPSEWQEKGQLVELLNGFRVVAVGKLA